MIICVTGCVATGKSTVARLLAKRLRHKYLDANKLIKKRKLTGDYIKKLDSYEVDVRKLNKFLIGIINRSNNLIIDSHLSHYLPREYVDYCVVCKCGLKVLKKRLEDRKYSKRKISENLDSEIFDVCFVEALEKKHKIIVVDTSEKSSADCVREIIKAISSAKSSLPV